MFAEILTIGDELCRGEIVDTNSSWLAGRLWDLDVTVRWMTSCRDEADDMRRAFRDAVGRADLVVCSGGLGPTEDDLTVDVLSEVLGVEPMIDEAALAAMQERYAQLRFRAPPNNLRQVRVPTGARVYANPAGAAPGFEVDLAGVPVFCLPGVPREVHAICDSSLWNRVVELREARGVRVERIARRIYRVFGRGESQISASAVGVVDGIAGATLHYQVKFPETLVKVVIRDVDVAAAAARLDAVDTDLRGRLAPYLYGTGEDGLPDVLGRALVAAGATVATAESCTGGLVGQLITSVAGSSAYYLGGAITYSNEEKVRQLGVSEETLEAHGAVSEETVIEMARGARSRFGASHALAVSGIAGPGGGTPDKPVGTVWLAVAGPDGAGGERVVARRINWPGARDQVRTLAAYWGMAMLHGALQGRWEWAWGGLGASTAGGPGTSGASGPGGRT